MTEAQLTAFSSDATTRKLRTQVLAARAGAETIRAHVDSYVQPHFESFGFTDSTTGETLPNVESLYRHDDEAACADFYKSLDQLHAAHGYEVEEGVCPALSAEVDAMDAEKALLDHFYKAFPEYPMVFKTAHRAALLDVIMNAPAH